MQKQTENINTFCGRWINVELFISHFYSDVLFGKKKLMQVYDFKLLVFLPVMVPAWQTVFLQSPPTNTLNEL